MNIPAVAGPVQPKIVDANALLKKLEELEAQNAQLQRALMDRDSQVGELQLHLDRKHDRFVAVVGELNEARNQLNEADNLLNDKQNQVNILDRQLVSWRTEYKGFASVMSPIFGLAGSAISVYATMNSISAANGFELLLGGYEKETLLLAIAIGSYAASSLIGPAIIYAGSKLIDLVKDLLIVIPKMVIEVVKFAIETCFYIVKKMWEYRTAILLMAVLGTVAYYNPVVNTMIAPYYGMVANLPSHLSLYGNDLAEWAVDVVMPEMQAVFADPTAYRLPMSLQMLLQISKSLSAMALGYMNNGVPVAA